MLEGMVMTESEERNFIRAAFVAADVPLETIIGTESMPVSVVISLYPDVLLTNIEKARQVQRVASFLSEDPFSKHLLHLLSYGSNLDDDLNVFLSHSEGHKDFGEITSPVEQYVYEHLGESPYCLTGSQVMGNQVRFHAVAYAYVIKEWYEDYYNGLVNRAGKLFEVLNNEVITTPRFVHSYNV